MWLNEINVTYFSCSSPEQNIILKFRSHDLSRWLYMKNKRKVWGILTPCRLKQHLSIFSCEQWVKRQWVMGRRTPIITNPRRIIFCCRPQIHAALFRTSLQWTSCGVIPAQDKTRSRKHVAAEWSRYWSSEVALQQNKLNVGHSSAALKAEPYSHISRYYGIEGTMIDLGSDSETPDWNCQYSPVRSASVTFCLFPPDANPFYLFSLLLSVSLHYIFPSVAFLSLSVCGAKEQHTHTGSTVRPNETISVSTFSFGSNCF